MAGPEDSISGFQESTMSGGRFRIIDLKLVDYASLIHPTTSCPSCASWCAFHSEI